MRRSQAGGTEASPPAELCQGRGTQGERRGKSCGAETGVKEKEACRDLLHKRENTETAEMREEDS